MDKVRKTMIMDGSQMPNSSLPRVPPRPESSSKNNVVGLDKDLMQLKDRLTTPQQRKLEIIPIVGMGGIGKTFLAQHLFNDPDIVYHFDLRAWTTISQDYDVRAILSDLLGRITGKPTDEMRKQENYQLEDLLHKSLSGRRYLIVLDDIWKFKIWDDIKRFFPNNNNGSRIVLTTRESYMANYVDSSRHQMCLLDESNSWDMLHQKVFGEVKCPNSLERIGKKIASNCGGLPLAIQVIGGLLSKAKRTKEFWEHVANDVSSVLAEKDEHFSKILSVSYNHLPHHLKPCFLYMGAFPGNYKIRASKLIRLWIAEGFIKPTEKRSLEEEAEEYLEALVDRNLILVQQHESHGAAKSYSIHNLLRDLCVRKASEEKFLCVKDRQDRRVLGDTFTSLRRVSANPSHCIKYVYAPKEHKWLARSFLCIGLASHEIISIGLSEFRLLRVLDVFDIEFHQFPKVILQLVNLRYLALFFNSDLPSAISRLWNLQTLVVGSNESSVDVPSELWEMSELRHIKFKKTVIWIESGYWKNFVQKELQTISATNLYGLIESNFLGSIPNIKNLGICFDFFPTGVVDLSHLHNLQTLKCMLLGTFGYILSFPPSVRKLTLSECDIPPRFMTTIGLLPNLEVLKIRNSTFQGQEMQPTDAVWEPTEDEFRSLQFLLLENLNLVHLRADDTNLPRLRRLVFRSCSKLEEIPCGIGDIPTLEIIDLDKCSPSAVASAILIWEEQYYNGNYGLEVRIRSSQ
ncbi:hypothetical protein Pfo_007505 [Paulownia fortunei]|nr:hypothetical protein Pfo_007505 [Paulownia fortunei]